MWKGEGGEEEARKGYGRGKGQQGQWDTREKCDEGDYNDNDNYHNYTCNTNN